MLSYREWTQATASCRRIAEWEMQGRSGRCRGGVGDAEEEWEWIQRRKGRGIGGTTLDFDWRFKSLEITITILYVIRVRKERKWHGKGERSIGAYAEINVIINTRSNIFMSGDIYV